MNILFVVKSKAIETLGPMYLAAIAKQLGHNAYIIEYDKINSNVMETFKPDIIGYSCMTGDQNKFIDLDKLLKDNFKYVSIIGGPHPTFFPEDFDDTTFDHVVQGEAESWFAEFLGAAVSTDLDALPFPDRSSFPNHIVRDFISSRGCPFNCKYCFNDQWNKLFPDSPKVRMRSVSNVLYEIGQVNPSFVYFQDSCFGVSFDWLYEFCMSYNKIPFHCHLRPAQVTVDKVKLLKHANCVSMRMALETASDRLRKIIGRPNTTNLETIKATHLLRDKGIKVMIQNMLALPTSTIDDDLATLEVNMSCQPDYAWSSIFAPFPGTALGDECKKKGWYTGDYKDITDCFFDESVLNFSDLYKEQTYCLQKIFALAVEAQTMPKLDELTIETLPQFVHRAMRRIGDNRIYDKLI